MRASTTEETSVVEEETEEIIIQPTKPSTIDENEIKIEEEIVEQV
ncbi:unnamed protein product, partial [Didymodactylos carnosus]